jgi:hypothetical protein
MQILIGICGTGSLAAVYVLERANAWLQIQAGGQVAAESSYLRTGLVFAGLMLMFYLRFGREGKGTEACYLAHGRSTGSGTGVCRIGVRRNSVSSPLEDRER